MLVELRTQGTNNWVYVLVFKPSLAVKHRTEAPIQFDVLLTATLKLVAVISFAHTESTQF
jgi:hypothetical protein